MSYVDIAIIVIVALCALLGLKKGLFKTAIGFFGWLITFVLAFFLTRTVAYALLDVQFFRNFVLTGEKFSLYSWVSGWLPNVNITPGGFFDKMLGSVFSVSAAGISSMNAAAMLVAYYLFCVMVFLGLFIGVRLVMTLFIIFAKSFLSGNKPSGLSRLAGFLLGAVRGALYCCLILLVAGYATAWPKLNAVGEKIDESAIGKPLYSMTQKMSDKIITKSDEDTVNKLATIMFENGMFENETETETQNPEDITPEADNE